MTAASSDSCWTRRGRILSPADVPGQFRLLQAPTAWCLPDGTVRLVTGGRDPKNQGRMLTLDLDPADGMRIIRAPMQSSITPDRVRAFGYESFSGSCAVWHDGRLWLYSSALKMAGRLFEIVILLFFSDDGGETFEGPQVLLTPDDNLGLPVTFPEVRRIGDEWRMWFTAYEGWRLDVQPYPDGRYSIRQAHSDDGLNWTVEDGTAIGLAGVAEAGLASPAIRPGGPRHEMWYSRRGPILEEDPASRRYRMGYATSDDGRIWTRQDESFHFANAPAPEDWDGQMQCYPSLLSLPDGQTCMFYCGNGYGEAGFGYATLD